MVFPTPIGLNRLDLGVQKTLNMSLKRIKYLFHIRFVFKKIDTTKTRIIINKANIILIPPGDVGCPPNIRVNQFKRYSRNTRRQRIW
jgi:hypothetical protein